MKHAGFAVGITLLTMAAAPAALAEQRDYDDGFYDSAKVTHVEPVYQIERINAPRRECYDEPVTHYRERNDSYTGLIAGGIVGGAIGNRFGHGRGRDIATIAGVALGASIGRDLSRDEEVAYTTTEQRCHEVDNYYEQRNIIGYDVSYRYKGHDYVTRTDRDPGRTIRVKVSVSPDERSYSDDPYRYNY